MQCPCAPFLRRVCGPAFTTAILLIAANCPANTLTFSQSGLSLENTPLNVSAIFETGTGNLLTLTLRSSGSATKFKSDVLTSFYFNLSNPSGTAPLTLTYQSGTGQAFEVIKNGTDQAVSWTPDLVAGGGTWTTSGTGASNPSSLVAIESGNEGWQFVTTTPPPVPGFRFGIGTVGNNNIANFLTGASPFSGPVVSGTESESMINLGIYSTGNGAGTDIDPSTGLDGRRLVQTQAVFHFTSSQSLAGFDSSWVSGNVAFGFGTNPDSIVVVPEPSAIAIAIAGGVVVLAAWGARPRGKRQGREVAGIGGSVTSV